ncbi:MAG: transposase [Solirubrobacterales bacterium]|nr:transposase [Solirubrobacterales bacterium]
MSCAELLKVKDVVSGGWRFVVEELRRVGAVVHLAEPAETAGLRGPKKRAKGDRADARHLRELVMLKRVPESWIAPDHILDLRARVRLRHELGEQRSEWQQRIQATLSHHGCPQRRQAGRKALMAHYGIGELTAVTILAELGDCTRFSSSRWPGCTGPAVPARRAEARFLGGRDYSVGSSPGSDPTSSPWVGSSYGFPALAARPSDPRLPSIQPRRPAWGSRIPRARPFRGSGRRPEFRPEWDPR